MNTKKTKNTNLLTGIRDLDREIINQLDDIQFLNICKLNRTYYERVCDEDYFRIRTEKRFQETIPYKDYIEFKNWKAHYINIVKYIDLLEKRFNRKYVDTDKSPELLYRAHNSFSTDTYTISAALICSSYSGDLPVVKYLVEIGADIHAEEEEALRWATSSGQLSVAKYLVEKGAIIHANNSRAFIAACQYGHLEVVKYLVEHGADVTTEDNSAVLWGCYNGYLSVVKYLSEHGADIHAEKDLALHNAIERGHSDIVTYLQSLS